MGVSLEELKQLYNIMQYNLQNYNCIDPVECDSIEEFTRQYNMDIEHKKKTPIKES